MKAPAMFVFALYGLLATIASASQDRKITEVVKLLQTMLEKSKADGDTERNLYAKYKCYCDTNEADKTAEIERLTKEIAVLGAKIEELQAHNGKLSKEVAKLDADMAQNKQDREEATALRKKENEEFLAEEADLVQAIAQMKDAIKVLAEIGADQSLSSAADHAQYMAGHEASMLKLKTSLKTSLVAASAFVSQKKMEPLESFIQAPFTGTYSARSGEVVGILKDMKDTFKANLASAREAEKRAQTAYDKYMADMVKAFDEMESAYNTKQGLLSGNDDDLSSKRTQLEAAESQKAEAEDFLAKLLEMCASKKKQYENRVDLRTQEEAALSEAIAILNSDAAFATFGSVSATSTGAQFFQKKSTIRRHRQLSAAADASNEEPRKRAMGFLQAAEEVKGSSPLLGRIMAMLQANNPFKTVLEEIEKMLGLIEKEGEADADQKNWCDKERKETNDNLDSANKKIEELTAAITELNTTINDPSTGLIVQIKNTEDDLETNYNSQVSETKERIEENMAYQKNIADLVEAEALLAQALKVLQKYYTKIIDGKFVQVSDDPAPPSTWEDTYTGQSGQGTGAIGMIKFILGNTKKEEEAAHNAEVESQHSYEDSMQSLKDSEASLQELLVTLKQKLAEAEKELQLKSEDLAKTEAEKAALEAYLLKIKPGCDFIDENLDNRIESRGQETESLKQAIELLKKTPVYREAMEAQHQEGLGECQGICKKTEDHVDCKAASRKSRSLAIARAILPRRAALEPPGYATAHACDDR
eukprot:CAMPEP_0183397194 /NCGR_PEP_ID=MMETSP0370-20130417/10436_1 /TAXON_ID=268820 /ORGANISM="Peridinium aciculiferum, Strain PAER-2" /LENGTH=761 /DNA_ID=CAMNT_0025578041 /DNA_START=74 /DNA_END=2360 /DNA_ORIENTATION=+